MGQAAVKRDGAYGRSCLLVEDSEFDQHRVTRMLKGAGPVDLIIATTLAEAGSLLQKQRFDLVILDNALPDGLGVDFAMGIRRLEQFRNLPVIIVSDFPSPFMYDKAMAARVSRVLTKSEFRPWHVKSVLGRLGR